jgi:hypothetical protein
MAKRAARALLKTCCRLSAWTRFQIYLLTKVSQMCVCVREREREREGRLRRLILIRVREVVDSVQFVDRLSSVSSVSL